MSSDYDPFAGRDDNREVHHRINQALAKSGGHVVLDWKNIDRQTAELNSNIGDLSEFDRNPLAQRLAAELVSHTRLSWSGGPIPTDTRLFGEYDSSSPTQLFALTWPSYAQIALRNLDDLKSVAAEAKQDEMGCHAHVTKFCTKTITETFAVKRGEYICVFACCSQCLEHVNNPDASNDTGPSEHWMAALPENLGNSDDDDDFWS